MLKIAGVKTEAAFYKKYPTEEAFMKVHGKAFKKAQMGAYIGGETQNIKPISYKEVYDDIDLSITGKTNDMREEEAYKLASLKAQQKESKGGFLDNLAPILSNLSQVNLGEARYGKNIPTAQFGNQFGNMFNNGFNPGNQNVPNNIGFNPTNPSQLTQPSGFNMPNYSQQWAQNNPLPTGSSQEEKDSIGNTINKYAGIAGKVVQGFQALKAEKEQYKGVKQMRKVSDLALKASRTRPEETQRRYVRPEDMITSGNQLNPSYGMGTNVIAQDGKTLKKISKITGINTDINNSDPALNTKKIVKYQPGVTWGKDGTSGFYLYSKLPTDKGFNVDRDREFVKNTAMVDVQRTPQWHEYVKQSKLSQNKFQNGGSMDETPWGAIGDIGSNIGGAIVGQDAGSQLGGTIGGALGSAFGPIGGAIGKTLGTVAGGLLDPYDKKMKKENQKMQRNITNMSLSNSIQGLQSSNSSYMKDGGYVSHDWNPQLIAKFGDHSPEDIYDFAHQGMNTLRAGGHLKSYTEPSEEALTPYAMGGELQTHWGGHMEELSQNPYLPDDGVTYMPHGQSHDEADGKGRTGIGITYGNNPVEVERKEPIMKLKDGSSGEDNLVVFGNLEIPDMGVNILGDKNAKGKKFKNYIADLSKTEKKQNNTIDKTTDELDTFNPKTSLDKLRMSSYQSNLLGSNMKLKEIAEIKQKAAALQGAINDTAEEFGLDADHLAKGKAKLAKFGGKFSKAQGGKTVEPTELNEVEIHPQLKSVLGNLSYKGSDIHPVAPNLSLHPVYTDIPETNIPTEEVYSVEEVDPKSNKWISAANAILPHFRSSNARPLSGNQLLGEMYAMSNNQVDPVQAQTYTPELSNYYSVSLQDQMNEITAQTRAAQKMAQGNPSAQAAIAAQAYEAINKVKGEEFRMNQALSDKVFSENRAAMNDAKLRNLGIFDQQYVRQSQAKSNSKAIAQAALNSISDKYAKNELENRTLKTYENMYNYRYDANGRLINMNPLAEFNIPTVGDKDAFTKDSKGRDLIPVYNKYGEPEKYIPKVSKSTKSTAKNGSIVRSLKNI